MGVSINGDTPIAGWFIFQNPINMDGLEVPPFQETSNVYMAKFHHDRALFSLSGIFL
jgi:hypothetical protein